MSALFEEEVLSVRHWTERLFSFTTTRSPSFRYENGQFTMIGLEVNGKPLLRAYSLVSPNYADQLEFLSIKVPDGPLTSKLQHLQVGDKILVGRKPTGTLLVDNLLPGRNLFLLGTGTGLAPFMSLVKDPAVYERFEKVILVHGCRFAAELAYADEIENQLPADELLGEEIRAKLLYYPTVTREDFRNRGRITKLLGEGQMTAGLGLAPLDPSQDRAMICGSPAFLADITALLKERGFEEGNSNEPGSYVIEKAFVER
jgi:ferredoxin--NADP+ reductase